MLEVMEGRVRNGAAGGGLRGRVYIDRGGVVCCGVARLVWRDVV